MREGRIKKLVLLFLLIFIAGTHCKSVFSQSPKTKPSRQSSMEAFSKGNYEKAYSDFKELLIVYPKDPQYKYYSGVCLVNLKRNSAEAELLLKESMKSPSAVKSLPSEVLFYLGRAQQMSGKFGDAIDSYNKYAKNAGKKIAKAMEVDKFITQCKEKTGSIGQTEVNLTEKALPAAVEILVVNPAPVLKDTNQYLVPAEFDKMLNDALNLQTRADSFNNVAAAQKKQLEKLPPADRSSLKIKISENEITAASLQKAADQKFNEAQATANPKVEISVDSSFIVKPKPENIPVTPKKSYSVTQKQVEIFSVFEVLPKPVKDPKEKILVDPLVPPGLIYRIQIAVFRNPVAPEYFKGVTPIYGFKLAGTDKTNYYAGMFRRSADASRALSEVKKKGFKDAFVVALSNKKAVSSDRAAVLEKEWGKKPFMVISSNAPRTPADTVPPALAFRVEVIRSAKPLKEDVIQGITKMAGSRGLDNQITDDGKIAYLIGKFITFESAAEYSDLLVRNGYRESRVVAWLGKKEIPLDTARKLFDDLK